MTSSWSIKLAGIPAFREILRNAAVASGNLAATGLWQEGLKMMAASQREVPVRWGILRSTGTVHAPTKRGSGIEVILSYGGPAAPYAWIQHEKVNLRHDSPTKAKYLEDPVMAQAGEFAGQLARRMSWLFATNQVLGSSWPQVDWNAPTARRARMRRSPRRTIS